VLLAKGPSSITYYMTKHIIINKEIKPFLNQNETDEGNGNKKSSSTR
jgi:hypothetical protein